MPMIVVTMRVTVSMAVMMMSTCGVHSPEIDSQTDTGDEEELMGFHFRWVDTKQA